MYLFGYHQPSLEKFLNSKVSDNEISVKNEIRKFVDEK